MATDGTNLAIKINVKALKTTKTILLAEDEEPILSTLTFILKREGYEVLPTRNGEEALQQINKYQQTENSIDLLVTDIQMARLTGMQLIDKLNTLGISIPVLVITGYGNKETVVELLRKGCMEYIDKPFKPSLFLERVKEVLDKEETRLIKLEQDKAELRRNLENYKFHSDRFFKDIKTAVNAFNTLTEFDPSRYDLPLAYRSLPFSHLGGDLFLIRKNPRGYDILVADVAGHDLGSSFYAVLIKGSFEDPNQKTGDGNLFLRLLNAQLTNSLKEKILITAVFISLDLEAMQGEIVLAGHHTPVLLKGETMRTFPSGGNVIGILEDVQFGTYTVSLEPGQRFLLYTDGIVYVSRPGGISGQEKKLLLSGLKELIRTRASLPLNEMIDHIFTDILFYCNQKPRDDMLLLGIEIPGVNKKGEENV